MRAARHGNVAVQLQQICKFSPQICQFAYIAFAGETCSALHIKTRSTIAAAIGSPVSWTCLKYQHGGEVS